MTIPYSDRYEPREGVTPKAPSVFSPAPVSAAPAAAAPAAPTNWADAQRPDGSYYHPLLQAWMSPDPGGMEVGSDSVTYRPAETVQDFSNPYWWDANRGVVPTFADRTAPDAEGAPGTMAGWQDALSALMQRYQAGAPNGAGAVGVMQLFQDPNFARQWNQQYPGTLPQIGQYLGVQLNQWRNNSGGQPDFWNFVGTVLGGAYGGDLAGGISSATGAGPVASGAMAGAATGAAGSALAGGNVAQGALAGAAGAGISNSGLSDSVGGMLSDAGVNGALSSGIGDVTQSALSAATKAALLGGDPGMAAFNGGINAVGRSLSPAPTYDLGGGLTVDASGNIQGGMLTPSAPGPLEDVFPMMPGATAEADPTFGGQVPSQMPAAQAEGDPSFQNYLPPMPPAVAQSDPSYGGNLPPMPPASLPFEIANSGMLPTPVPAPFASQDAQTIGDIGARKALDVAAGAPAETVPAQEAATPQGAQAKQTPAEVKIADEKRINALLNYFKNGGAISAAKPGSKPGAPPTAIEAPPGAPARQPSQSDAEYSQALVDYLNQALAALTGGTAGAGGTGGGDGQGGDGTGLQGLVDLSAQTLADLGLTPGTPQYYDYIMSQLQAAISKILNGLDPQDAKFGDQLRAKTGGEMDALYRALYVRGVLGQLMGSGRYQDPFTGNEEDVIGPDGAQFNPSMGAYQRGLARNVDELRGMGPEAARKYLNGMLGRNPDLFGMQASADARRMKQILAALGLGDQGDPMKRRQRGMLGDSAFMQSELGQLSDGDLASLLGNAQDPQAALEALLQLNQG